MPTLQNANDRIRRLQRPRARRDEKARRRELRAEGKKGAKKADGLQAVLDSIAEMAPEDHARRARGT